jgi:hypothetical protein
MAGTLTTKSITTCKTITVDRHETPIWQLSQFDKWKDRGGQRMRQSVNAFSETNIL